MEMEQNFEVLHTTEQDSGAFQVRREGKKAGELTYKKEGEDCLVVEHTTVEEGFQGQGVGRLLVDAVVAYARSESFCIRPECSYVKALFDRVSELQDVLITSSK